MNQSFELSERGLLNVDFTASPLPRPKGSISSNDGVVVRPQMCVVNDQSVKNVVNQIQSMHKLQNYNVMPSHEKNNSSNPQNCGSYYSATTAESPIDRDVLFARGGLTNHHPGNKRLRELVKEFKNKYDQSNKRVKTQISQYIVDKIKGEGGRFLKRDEKSKLWNVVQNNEARRKASQSLRDCHQYGKKKTNTDNEKSSLRRMTQPQSSVPMMKLQPQSVSSNSAIANDLSCSNPKHPNKMLCLLEVVSQERSQENENRV